MIGQDETNVTVAVRLRPLSKEEKARGEHATVYCPDQRHLLVSHAGHERAFKFDVVLGPESSQQDVFEECGVKRLIDMAIDGFSCTMFAFGQTGSGKTHTVTGPRSLFLGGPREHRMYGLMQRSLSYLLDQVESMDGEFSFSASYLEIYNEQVWDLFNPWSTYSLSVRGSKTRGFYVENLSAVKFCNLEDFTRLLEEGMQNRQTSSHAENEHSSRSHSILTVHVKGQAADAEVGSSSQGKLCVVDLAGSERVRVTGRADELLEETSNINRSLLALGKCISALVDPKKRDGHIPYRDSKLTMLLSDSLGGAGVTLMIACVSPTLANLQETMNTLRYSSRAKKIKNRPMAKKDLREKLVISLQKEISSLRRENMLLRQRLSTSEGGTRRTSLPYPPLTGSSNSLLKSEKSPERSESSCSEASLRSLLQELMRENDRLQQDKMALLTSSETSKQQRELLSRENTRLMRKLGDLERVISSSPTTNSSHSGLSINGVFSSLPFIHHQHSLSAVVPHQKHPNVTDQSFFHPGQPVGHHGGFLSENALLTHLPWHVKSCIIKEENPALYNPVPYCKAARADEQNRQLGALPPLQGPHADRVPSVGSAPVQPESQSSDPGIHHRKKSQVERREYAERFHVMRETAAQEAPVEGNHLRGAPGKLVPSAPPLSSLPPLQ